MKQNKTWELDFYCYTFLFIIARNRIQTKGSSINDITVLGGGGQGFCDDST